MIVEERPSSGRALAWYLGRWEGCAAALPPSASLAPSPPRLPLGRYHPSWEKYRINGRQGIDPIETWEPERNVKGTTAFEEWAAAKRARAAET